MLQKHGRYNRNLHTILSLYIDKNYYLYFEGINAVYNEQTGFEKTNIRFDIASAARHRDPYRPVRTGLGQDLSGRRSGGDPFIHDRQDNYSK